MPIRILSNELQKISEEELNEKPQRVQEDIKHIREWLRKQSHLVILKDDQWLLNFLRSSKFSLQRTKEKIDNFYKMRATYRQFFSNRDPFLPEIQDALKYGTFLPFPKSSIAGEARIILFRCDCIDPKIVTFTTAVKTAFMIMDILLNEDDHFIIAGLIGFVDVKGMIIAHAGQQIAGVCRRVVQCLQDAYPTRFKNAICFNSSLAVFNNVSGYVEASANAKVASRIHFFRKCEQASKVLPPSVLPPKYGGHGSSVEKLIGEWKAKVESYKDWFLEDAKSYSAESRRVGEPETSVCMFGSPGSFRKLDTD